MNQSDLIKKFISIAKKGWIKSVKENHGGVGMTFENELGKKPDADFFPDYNGIEIKCTTRFSDYRFFYYLLHLMVQVMMKQIEYVKSSVIMIKIIQI